mmetsp:Transcript_76010/g.246151  ORF Transcript_76010/g.246151 Transcript_76010/m.246151 type:complete len:264 (-) Transcript_76010:1433-2224(-)
MQRRSAGRCFSWRSRCMRSRRSSTTESLHCGTSGSRCATRSSGTLRPCGRLISSSAQTRLGLWASWTTSLGHRQSSQSAASIIWSRTSRPSPGSSRRRVVRRSRQTLSLRPRPRSRSIRTRNRRRRRRATSSRRRMMRRVHLAARPGAPAEPPPVAPSRGAGGPRRRPRRRAGQLEGCHSRQRPLQAVQRWRRGAWRGSRSARSSCRRRLTQPHLWARLWQRRRWRGSIMTRCSSRSTSGRSSIPSTVPWPPLRRKRPSLRVT